MDLFSSSVGRCSTGFSWWMDLGQPVVFCVVQTLWLLSRRRRIRDGLEFIYMSPFDLAGYLGHPFSSLLRLLFWALSQPRATGKQKVNSEPQISSSCPRWENKWLFSWATLPYLFSSLPLLHLSIPRSCGFFITGLLSSIGHAAMLLALTLCSLSSFLLPSSVYWL